MTELAHFPPAALATSAQLVAHEADTTAVHGLSDAAELLARTDNQIGFFGNARAARPAAYNQAAYVAATRVHDARASAQPAATAATNVAPFGYSTAAQADAVNNGVRNLVTDVTNIKQLLNSVIDDLQTLGLLQ